METTQGQLGLPGIQQERPKTMSEDEALHKLVEEFIELRADRKPTPNEKRELIAIARGDSCRDSATKDGVTSETIRNRRKHLYIKLDVDGATDIQSNLLCMALRKVGGVR